MRNLIAAIGVVIVLAFVVLIVSTGQIPGVRPQTADPNASTLVMTANEGALFLGWVIFLVVGPLTTLIAVIALAAWLLNREVNTVRKEKRTAGPIALILRRPGVTVAVTIFLLVGFAVTLALLDSIF